MEIVRELLSCGADPSQQFTLQAAAQFGNVDMMKILIQHGAKINMLRLKGEQSLSVLRYACLSGSEAAVKYALQCGAVSTVRDEPIFGL